MHRLSDPDHKVPRREYLALPFFTPAPERVRSPLWPWSMLRPAMPLLSLADLRQHLRDLGALPLHEGRVLRRWARAQPQDGGKRPLQDFLPRALREALPALV